MRPTALGAFIFAGGFTLGVKRAGFKVLAQFESGPFGVETTRYNHPKLPVFDDPATWPAKDYAGKVDFIYGNPPCAPFSAAGISTEKQGSFHDWWKRDPRVTCIHQQFSLLETIRPRVWAWESVQPAFKRGRELVDELTEVARGFGYGASYVLTNAAHLGVPQIRRRFFCVFHAVQIPWKYEPVEREATVGEAFASIQNPLPEVASHCEADERYLKTMKPGYGPRDVWEEQNPDPTKWVRNEKGHVKGRPSFTAHRLRADRPSCTMIGGAHLFHPTENRYITVQEAQVLCGYPEDYHFVAKTTGDKYAQIAKAVMPPVGEWLARNVKAGIAAGKPANQEVWLVNLEKGRREQLR